MATITEDYVSFETAKLLREKGFNIPCDYAYNNKACYFEIDRSTFDEVYCFRPSVAMAMKWLREVRNRFIEVQTDKGHDFKSIVFRPAIYDEDLNCLWESDNYKSYEQAAEAAIKHCLEHLNNHGNN